MRLTVFICTLSAAVVLAAAEPEAQRQPTADLRQDILPYERMYFALDPGWTTERPLNAKFQLSLAFRIIEVEGIPADYLRDDGYYGGFVQTTVWDLGGSSKPIIDASYIPEIWWHQGLGSTIAIEPGIGHESNGKGDDDSRSLFYGFLRWQQVWRGDSWAIIADPRLRYYVTRNGARDIADYRGYADLDLGWRHDSGLGIDVRGRIGQHGDRGSLLTEVVYPTTRLTAGLVRGLLYAQHFWGWSETLLGYRERTEDPRVLLGYAIQL